MAANAESKTPPRNRSQFVRTEIPRAERVVSVLCVLLLAAIGVAIFIKGRHFDPNLYALRTDALKSTAENVEGKSGTICGEAAQARGVVKTATVSAEAADEGHGEAASTAKTAAKPAPTGEQLVMTVAGIKPMGDTEFYSADTLYEKIDGRAPAYLGFNFQNLRTRSFEVLGAAGSFVDVYEFHFDTPINAFGMFALERDPKGAALAFAPDGYAGELGYYFRQGACYVQIIASDTKEKTIAIAKAVAQDRAKALPVDNAGLDARRRLPATGLDPASVQFTGENAMGQEFLKNVFQATYAFGGKKLPFFVMAATPEEAAAAWQSFFEFSGKFGGKVTALPDVNGAKVFQAESFGTFKVIYQKDGAVGGVFDADDGGAAREFVEQYLTGKIQ
ncbi:MAG: hypothetical protein NTZ16_00510 [Verrucomicrobia bacterium]|nr:hypothetical protein [Verrucomicrobiota bacterium]